MENTLKPVICQIIAADDTDASGRACVTVEMRSSDPDQKDSMANLLTGWFAHNWDELFMMFRAQLKAHKQETEGTADVAASTPGPRLLNAEGTAYTSSDDQLDMFANTMPAIVMDDSYSAPRTETYEAPAACYDSPSASYDTSSSSDTSSCDTSSSSSSSDQ